VTSLHRKQDDDDGHRHAEKQPRKSHSDRPASLPSETPANDGQDNPASAEAGRNGDCRPAEVQSAQACQRASQADEGRDWTATWVKGVDRVLIRVRLGVHNIFGWLKEVVRNPGEPPGLGGGRFMPRPSKHGPKKGEWVTGGQTPFIGPRLMIVSWSPLA
jgi:hypothetical protein